MEAAGFEVGFHFETQDYVIENNLEKLGGRGFAKMQRKIKSRD